jgi:hypothetical protein
VPEPEKNDLVIQELRAIQDAASDLQRRIGMVIKELGGEGIPDAAARAELARQTVEKLRQVSRARGLGLRTSGRGGARAGKAVASLDEDSSDSAESSDSVAGSSGSEVA